MQNKIINCNGIQIANNKKITLIAGPGQLESEQHAMDMSGKIKEITSKLNIGFVYKTSFDKANRTSLKGKRGVGLENSLPVFDKIKKQMDIPILTDVHNETHCELVSKHVDIIQIPAFLCRQTDLIKAACETKLPLNIKKGQFLSPGQMLNIINKCHAFDNKNIILCERGSSFGYNNLIVDFLGISELKNLKKPVILDVTHSLQIPGGQGNAADGRSSQALDLALAGTAIGLAGLFIEVHPDPRKALCDGPSATRLDEIENILSKVKSIDNTVKSF
jgi:2-dehydro-3-deoxyphosphooctonate aldolase (KDO 8-P synthase)